MHVKNCILPLILLFITVHCYAQKDSLLKTDTTSLKTSIFINDFLNSRIGSSDKRFTPINHKLYNPDIYKLGTFNPFFIGWPFEHYPRNNYNQYSLRNNFYNKYNPSNPYVYHPYQTNPWYDPTNPSGANSAEDALILGSLNYLLFKIILGE